ncbi:MAG: DNA repair protein RecO [Candidatus Omnitrophota bacterium]
MAIIQTRGIVLKSFDYRETSRIATFFTSDQGRVSGVLKGIRKDPRKFGSSLERFSVNDIVYYQYRNSDLHLISQCDMREFFLPVRQDLKRSLAASYMLELVYLMTPSEMPNSKIYRLMEDFLRSLEQTEEITRLVHLFQIKALLYSGFQPHLDACVLCHKKVHNRAVFSHADGGLICGHCGPGRGETHAISPGTVATILHVERAGWQVCQKLKLTRITRRELKYILNNFLVFHLGRRIRSAKYV